MSGSWQQALSRYQYIEHCLEPRLMSYAHFNGNGVGNNYAQYCKGSNRWRGIGLSYQIQYLRYRMAGYESHRTTMG